jgi:undecaprenyl diphosphate synthase
MNNSVKKTINHLAVIMDGNRRWAKQNNLANYQGHRVGAQKAKMLIELAAKAEIKHLSLFVFSAENWHRTSAEVRYLLNLFESYLINEVNNLVANKIKLSVIGDIIRLDAILKRQIESINSLVIEDPVMNLYVCFSYGAQQEIVDAVKKAIKSNIDPQDLSVENFTQFLYSPEMPQIDMMIRTSGRRRISNFLLWHMAYAELYFIDKYWPDFNEEDFNIAIEEYKNRNRTFGKNES